MKLGRTGTPVPKPVRARWAPGTAVPTKLEKGGPGSVSGTDPEAIKESRPPLRASGTT